MKRPSVLLVDEDAAVLRERLRGEFERMTMDFDAAASVDEATTRAAASPPDVVLLSLESGVDGNGGALHRIAASAPGTQVIVVTGEATIDMALAAMRAGAFDYVRKPFLMDELEMRIRRALAWRTAALAPGPTGIPTLRDAERLLIRRALAATGGRRAAAAGLLGISERNLYRKIRTYQLDTPQP